VVDVEHASGPGWDLHCGRWESALSHVGEVDALIVDAPYSERTHAGQRHGRRDGAQWVESEQRWASSRGIGYGHMAASDVVDFVSAWAPRTRGWFASLTDSELYPAWRDSLRSAGLYVFAPLPCVQVGMNVRLAGDGPSNWTCWIVVARPAALHKWGTLQGGYWGNPFDAGQNTATASRRSGVVGSKPLWLMRALVRDYTRPGDLVCDPCAGGSTTLLAAVMEGRRAIGAEMDPAHYLIGKRRLERGFTPPLFTERRAAPVQQRLLGDDDDAP